MPDSFKIHGSQKLFERHTRPFLQQQPNGLFKKRSSNELGYTYRWQKFRELWFKRFPLCVICKSKNKIVPATDLDHIKPHNGDAKLFWDPNNLQGLCKCCHSKKTAGEDGGFGNNRRKEDGTNRATA